MITNEEINKAKKAKNKIRAASDLLESTLQEFDIYNATLLTVLVSKKIFTMKEFEETKAIIRPTYKKNLAIFKRKITMAFKNI